MKLYSAGREYRSHFAGRNILTVTKLVITSDAEDDYSRMPAVSPAGGVTPDPKTRAGKFDVRVSALLEVETVACTMPLAVTNEP